MGDFVVSASGATGSTVLANPATIGIFPNNDLRGLSAFPGSLVGGVNTRVVSAKLGEIERYRLLTECARHYTRNTTA